MPQAEFTSAEDIQARGAPAGRCGGPSEASVKKQIKLIEDFLAARS